MMAQSLGDLPFAVVGAGPVGLAAAAHLAARGLPVKLYEAGPDIGSNVRDWGHVRLFTPWRFCVDAIAAEMLERSGWSLPDAGAYPTGADLVWDYLKPLSGLPALRSRIETGARVTAITRHGIDKVVGRGREDRPFSLTIATPAGTRVDLARAVVDASGTWATPNPLGADGTRADGESEFDGRIAYGVPDVAGRDRPLYAGRSTLVVGAGHSAANTLIELARLAESAPGTTVSWAIRGTDLERIFGGGGADGLPARGALGTGVRQLVETGGVSLTTGFPVRSVAKRNGRLMVTAATDEDRTVGPIDRIVVATGQRPDLGPTRELRLDLDPWLESARALGPMIDPNLHSCGSVPPHGHRELAHPERDFFTVGVKSYGRAPTFLMLTGYEQVRSVVAALAGDMAAADDLRLDLPESGVCSVPSATPGGCCGGPAPSTVPDACCLQDAVAKTAGRAGCGCGEVA